MTSAEDIQFKHSVGTMLRNIADALEQDRLDEFSVRILTDLFIKFKFMTSELKEMNEDKEDLLQFMALGWHIYTNLAK